MKYAIVFLIKGNAEKYHKGLVKKFAEKFDEPYILENPMPSHATLKYSFETKNINEIEELLQEFCKKTKPARIEIKKVNKFDKKVLYLQLNFSKKAINIYRGLIKELKKKKKLGWKKFDEIAKFHATLVYCNTPESYKKAWPYALKLKPNFKLKFDNISILKKARKGWRIYKTFRIKDYASSA